MADYRGTIGVALPDGERFTMGLKEDLLEQARREFLALKASFAGLDEGRLTRAWLGTWSVRDILAHISSWHREMIPVLQRLARGEKPIAAGTSYEDVDAWNARFSAAKAGVPLAAVLTELDASHHDFVAAAELVEAARFQPGKTATRVVELNGPHHYQEHGEQIRAWRRQAGV